MRGVAFSSGSVAISSRIGSGSSYRVCTPSRLSTANPPSLPISTAVAGDTTPSIADAISGRSNVHASISQEMSTSSGSLVRREGTMATLSKPYARLPVLPMPISMSIRLASRFADGLALRREAPARGRAGARCFHDETLAAPTGVVEHGSMALLALSGRAYARPMLGRQGTKRLAILSLAVAAAALSGLGGSPRSSHAAPHPGEATPP